MLIGAGVAALALVATTMLASKEKLYSGHFVVKAEPAASSTLSKKEVINVSAKILTERLNAAGSSFTIKNTGDDILDISMKHIPDTAFASRVLATGIEIEFREMYTINELISSLIKTDSIAIRLLNTEPVTTPVEPKEEEDIVDSPTTLKRFKPEEHQEVISSKSLGSLIIFSHPSEDVNGGQSYPAEIGFVSVADTAMVNRIIKEAVQKKYMPYDAKFCYGTINNPQHPKELLGLYAIRTKGFPTALIRNEDINLATASADRYGNTTVSMQFTPVGSRKWAKMTRANIGHPIALLLNNQVITAPTVNSAIEDGNSEISGNFTLAEAQSLASMLKSGRIPANFTIIRQEIVEENVMFSPKFLLFALAGFIIGSVAAWAIFKSLKIS